MQYCTVLYAKEDDCQRSSAADSRSPPSTATADDENYVADDRPRRFFTYISICSPHGIEWVSHGLAIWVLGKPDCGVGVRDETSVEGIQWNKCLAGAVLRPHAESDLRF